MSPTWGMHVGKQMPPSLSILCQPIQCFAYHARRDMHNQAWTWHALRNMHDMHNQAWTWHALHNVHDMHNQAWTQHALRNMAGSGITFTVMHNQRDPI